MGATYSKYDEEAEEDSEFIRLRLLLVLHEQGAAELLKFAVKDRTHYEVCKNDDELRKACIVAASKNKQEVENNTPHYVFLLDEFTETQNANEEQKQVEEARSEQNSNVRRRKNPTQNEI
ncbi:uncharacterized protein LOC107399011 [Tribolium castaneum]|uniref:Uncharacterized protein n=1 Tax=Tribolium castaneum TaxID=7070 RepID=D6W6X9_TRICA|nr:PREDICTED: uncharacterized protein LOC107399011 [Tribolium castaneum]EFA11477.1 hypothetical protein TcasGA2_TC014188 [Tribolium castaneum]|eukprot:XP_015840148.1 PREDICTED: uncharacterized protein LOC107399011 [Tribolium castaneum]